MAIKVRDGEKYSLMPSLDGMILVDEFEDPAGGKARITLTDTNTGGKRSYEFTEGRKGWWRTRGMPPVVWHYVPPTRERAPQLLIAVDRLTRIEEVQPKQPFPTFYIPDPSAAYRKQFGGPDPRETTGGGGCGCHTGHHVRERKWDLPTTFGQYDGYVPVKLEPNVSIFRVQNPSLMPDLFDPSTIMSSIGTPHIILPGDQSKEIDEGSFDSNGELDFKKLTEHQDRFELATGILVLPQPHGVVFQALNNWFYLTVELKNPHRPGSFAYKVMTSGAVKVFWIDHDRNVDVKVTTVDAPSTRPILVFARRRWDGAGVAHQGEPIRYSKDTFRRVEVPDTRNTSMWMATQMVVETLMGFVPVIGDLYQFGQMGYMCATGNDFWGNKVSSADIVLYGALSLVGSGAPALMKNAASRSAAFSRPGAASVLGAMQAPNSVALGAMRQADEVASMVGGNRLVREINLLNPAQREQLLKPVLEAFESTADAVQAGEKAAKALHDGITAAAKADKKVGEAIEDIRAASMLTGDGKTFQNQYLRFEYDNYLAKAGTKGDPPLKWLSSSSRNPWVDKYCRTLFGTDYKKAIKGSLARNSVPATMTMDHIKHYDKIIGKGIANYGEMGRLARKVKQFGKFFELDHLIEQRFLKRFTDYTDAYAKGDAFGVFLVPKNAAVAAEMVKVASDSRLITYVHVVKTRMLSRRIPFGAEHLFNVQQIADATMHTLHKLGAGGYLDMQFLKTDFELLAKAMKQSPPVLKTAAQLTDDLFTAAKGWPQVKCDDWGRAILP